MAKGSSARAEVAGWKDILYSKRKEHGVTQFSYVPDAGHSRLIDLSLTDPEVQSIALTTEEEGVALAAGADLGGARSVLMMQSSGVGNCVNFFSMIVGGQFPFLSLVSMRGDYGEGNPWQMGMGQAVQPVLETMGIQCIRVEDPDRVGEAAEAGATMAFKSEQQVAVLLTQRLIGAKAF